MMLGLLCIVVLSFVFTAEATEVKIKETVEVDIDFDYVNSTVDKIISETLLDVGFTVETQNISMGNIVVEMKNFYRFIPVSFTQSKLNDFVTKINKITKSSNPNTVIDDFIKIGAVTSALLNHGDEPKLSRSKRECYVRRRLWVIPVAGCETDTSKKFGIGAEVDPFGVKVVLRYKNIRVRIPVIRWGKRDIEQQNS